MSPRAGVSPANQSNTSSTARNLPGNEGAAQAGSWRAQARDIAHALEAIGKSMSPAVLSAVIKTAARAGHDPREAVAAQFGMEPSRLMYADPTGELVAREVDRGRTSLGPVVA